MDDLDQLRRFREDVGVVGGDRDAARRRLDAEIAGAARRRRARPRRRAVWVGAAAVVCLLAAGTVLALPRDRADKGQPRAGDGLVFTAALAKFPNDTVSDVVSYADHVVVATAVAETEILDPAPPARAAAGESMVSRRITFRVESSLWTRAGASAAPATFDAVWWGWAVHDHQRTRAVGEGATWVEVGSRYLLPIAYDEGEFAPIQPFAVFPLRGESVTPTERQDSPLARALAGASPARVVEVFSRAAPDPVAARHMDLPPTERLAAVAAERSRG